jgi:hypothetical protein
VVLSCERQQTESALTLEDEQHPADELGKAISRANGILTSLSNCYDKSASSFAISLPFLFEGISAVEGILAGASDALTRLYDQYDLEKLLTQTVEAVAPEPEIEPGIEEQVVPAEVEETVEEPALLPDGQGPYLGFFGASETVSRLASNLDSILETMPHRAQPAVQDEILDHPAQTYAELLQKLTAMADAAAFKAHRSPGSDSDLLPALESLRADMLRIRTVA